MEILDLHPDPGVHVVIEYLLYQHGDLNSKSSHSLEGRSSAPSCESRSPFLATRFTITLYRFLQLTQLTLIWQIFPPERPTPTRTFSWSSAVLHRSNSSPKPSLLFGWIFFLVSYQEDPTLGFTWSRFGRYEHLTKSDRGMVLRCLYSKHSAVVAVDTFPTINPLLIRSYHCNTLYISLNTSTQM